MQSDVFISLLPVEVAQHSGGSRGPPGAPEATSRGDPREHRGGPPGEDTGTALGHHLPLQGEGTVDSSHTAN